MVIWHGQQERCWDRIHPWSTSCDTLYFVPDWLCIGLPILCNRACRLPSQSQHCEIITQVYAASQRLAEIAPHNLKLQISYSWAWVTLLNEENVFRAVDILLDDLAFGLSKYRVTVTLLASSQPYDVLPLIVKPPCHLYSYRWQWCSRPYCPDQS